MERRDPRFLELDAALAQLRAFAETQVPKKRKPGRPKGSKTKSDWRVQRKRYLQNGRYDPVARKEKYMNRASDSTPARGREY